MHRTGAIAASFSEWLTAAAMVAALSGCSPAGQAAMAEVGNLAGTASGFASMSSSGKVNDANAELARANARLVENQAFDLEENRDRLTKERPVVARLLFQMAGRERDPVLADLARWVEAGGDPDYAFKYMLTRYEEKAESKDQHLAKPFIDHSQSAAPVLPPNPRSLGAAPDTKTVPPGTPP
jgi:hypothetical protein